MVVVSSVSIGVSVVGWFIWQLEHKLVRDNNRALQEFEEELQKLQHPLLLGADAGEADEQGKLPNKALQKILYECADKVDDWRLLLIHKAYYKDGIKRHDSQFSRSFRPGKIHHQTAKEMKDIKRRLKENMDEYERRKIEGCSSPRSKKVDPRLGMIHKDASELVGIDGPTKDLVRWLSKEEGESAHQTKVVSILGSAGLGKTALAKQIFDVFGETFQYRAFVSVSKSHDMAEILSSISSQLHIRDYAEIEDRINQISEFLQDKRYCIIIDDIWDIDTWKKLDSALCKNSLGSVVVTTTRMNDVAQECCPSYGDLVYRIQPLSVADSKMLFFKRIFRCEEMCHSDLKEASDDILKKCEGLPLAINAISSLLSSWQTKEEWVRVGRSIDFTLGKNIDIDDMYYILSLSYLELPLHLRNCLLLFTMFPEDCQLGRDRLVQIWIAEGFIHGKNEENLVEKGEEYLSDLVNRSLIESVGMPYDDKAKFYRVHNVILDFLISKSTEENFSTLMNNPSNPDSKVQRLLLLGNEDEACVAQLDLSHIRLLGAIRNFERVSSRVKSYSLRVLDLQDCSEFGNHHIKDIGRHYKLRYLNISGTDISELPIQIGDLVYINTLDASFTELVEMPASITRLENLVRLFVSDETKLPDEIRYMYRLEELGDINTFKQSLTFLKVLGVLSELRKLGIIWDTIGISKFDKESYKEKKLVASLRELDEHNLHTLRVTFYLRDKNGFIGDPFLPALKSIREVFLRHGRICWIINWLLSLGNLEKLYVSSREEIEKQDLQSVGGIQSLLEFRLYSGCLGPIIISEGFQKLERLELKFSFSQLLFEVGATPNLKKLDLHIYLSKFKFAGAGFDFGIQNLSSLVWFSIVIFCEGVTAAYVEAAEEAFKTMAGAHRNLPTLKITRESTDFMLQAE